MAIRATISVRQVQASTTAIKAEAQTTYQKSNATGIWVDPDSDNRMLKEEIPLGDVLFNVMTKPLVDIATILELAAIDYSKPATPELLSVADNFIKVITYDRYINDAFALDDASLIDKDYYGSKGNVANMLDVMGVASSKSFTTDAYTIGDVVEVVTSYVKTFNDSISLIDTGLSPLNTFVLNTRQLNAGNLAFHVYRGNDQVDILGIADLPAVAAGKQFTDSLSTLASAFSDADSYSLSKGLPDDTVGCTDVFSYTGIFYYSKDFSNTVSIDGELTSRFTKNLQESSDIFSLSDTINVQRVTGGVMNATPLNRIQFN